MIDLYVWSVLSYFAGRNLQWADNPSKLWQKFQMPRRNCAACTGVRCVWRSQLERQVTRHIRYSDRSIQDRTLHLVNKCCCFKLLLSLRLAELGDIFRLTSWYYYLLRTMRQLHIAMTLEHLSESELLHKCSSSPSAEAPDFVDNLRR